MISPLFNFLRAVLVLLLFLGSLTGLTGCDYLPFGVVTVQAIIRPRVSRELQASNARLPGATLPAGFYRAPSRPG